MESSAELTRALLLSTANELEDEGSYGAFYRAGLMRDAAAALRALDQQLTEWRTWAQFVYGDGGPVSRDDASLRALVCAKHDEQIATLKQRLPPHVRRHLFGQIG